MTRRTSSQCYRSGGRSPGFVTTSSESCGAASASFTPSLARARRQIYATCRLWLPSSANRRCERSNVFWETPRNNLAQTSVRAGARIPKIALEATRSRGRRGEQSRGRCETLRSALRCRLERFPQRLFGTSTKLAGRRVNCALRGSCDFLGPGGRTNNAGLTKAFGAGFSARLPWKLLSLQRISSGSVSSPPVPG